MKVLVIYETVEGQSAKIARFAADTAQSLGHEVVTVDAGGMDPVEFGGVGAAILVAPVHQRRHPRSFEALLEANGEALAEARTLMLSVSLSAAFPEGQEEAHEYVVEMKMRTGFEPDTEALVAGAIKTEKYDYFALQVIRHVILRGKDVDPAAGDHEFTDWPKLERTVTDFLQAA